MQEQRWIQDFLLSFISYPRTSRTGKDILSYLHSNNKI